MDDNKKNTTSSPQTRSNKKSPKKNHNKKKKNWVLRIFLGFLALGLLAMLAGASVFWYYAKDAPALEDSKLEDSLSAKIYDINGKVIQELGEKKRETITANQVPEQLKDAIISIEDKRFDSHMGVDPIRIVGAALSNFRGGGGKQGGSTLTQQLIKLSYYSTSEEDQTIRRKAQEAWLSVKLERKKSKDEILMYYINKVYMSNGVYGMETAAQTYYGKHLSELSLAQTALLAGMPQAPNTYDPTVKTKEAQEATKKRRDLVLKEMRKDGKITQAEYDQAVQTPVDDGIIEQQQTSQNRKIIDNYITEVIKETEEKTKKNVYTDGMDIYTNLDLDAQTYLYNLVNSDQEIQFPSDEFQTAVTVIDPNTGQVRAQIGSRKVPDDVQMGENLAVTGARDAGSTVKPLTDYGPAIENLDYSTGRYILDGPYNYEGTNIAVNNYDYRYRGNLTMREALVDSRNVPAVKTLMDVGVDKSEEFLKGLGIEYPDGVFAANAISGNISSLNLAAAYAAFANDGVYNKPYYVNKIVFPDGQEEDYAPVSSRAMKDSTAYMVTDMLKDVINRGTGKNAIIEGLPQAGKTGTSNYDQKDIPNINGDPYGVPDITFVGYTRNYVISVWTGNKKYLDSISSEDQKIASEIYRLLMTYLSQNIETPDWEQPDSVVRQYGELFVKGHTNNQNTWVPPVSQTPQPPASSTPQSSSSSSSSSSEQETTSSSSSSQSVDPETGTKPIVDPGTSSTSNTEEPISGSGQN